MTEKIFVRRECDGVAWYTFAPLEEFGFMRHWITTRQGGVSRGGYAGLNLGDHVGDDPQAVEHNRAIVNGLLCDDKPVYLPKQVHGVEVAEPWPGTACAADGVMLYEPGVPCGVLTADCLPIIVADPVGERVALLHAGRLGVFKNIVAVAVAQMTADGICASRDLVAGIAPGIRSCCYEVGDDVFSGHEGFAKYRTSGKLDMVSAVRDQMAFAGIDSSNIYDSGVCTSCRVDEFFSHRAQEGNAGRFMTGAMIVGA